MSKRVIGEFATAVAEASDDADPMSFTLGPNKDEFYAEAEISFTAYGLFAQAAISGLDTSGMEGAAAVLDMMQDIIGPNPETEASKDAEWARFKQVSRVHKVPMEVMLSIVGAVLSGETGRPTKQPSDSSAGRPKTATSANSKKKSSRSKDADKPDFEPVTADVLAELGG